ncbi:MAG: hypothetical protein ACI84R_000265 [Candidatus Azotimanducaceae bacterium]|jgi:hypothetical protein
MVPGLETRSHGIKILSTGKINSIFDHKISPIFAQTVCSSADFHTKKSGNFPL